MGSFYDEEKCALEVIIYCLRKSYYLSETEIEFSQNIFEIGEALINVSTAIERQFQEIIQALSLDRLIPDFFATFVLPISFKLASDDLPRDLSTILACSFIFKLVRHINLEHDCFKFTDIARKCMILFLKRKCNYIFEDSDNRSRFTIFCMMLNASFASADEDTDKIDVLCCSDPVSKGRLLQVVADCWNPNEGIFITDEESAMIAVEDVIDYEKENEETPPRVCDFCGLTCEVFVDRTMKVYLAITSNKSGDSPRLLRVVSYNIPDP